MKAGVLRPFFLLAMIAAAAAPGALAQVSGWRGDGSGRYPDATPVAEWSPEKNVIWKTPMPGWSNSSPALAADRLFVLSEPDLIVCVSLADGRELWRRDVLRVDALDAGEAARLRPLYVQLESEGVFERFRRLSSELETLRFRMQDSRSNTSLLMKESQLADELGRLQVRIGPLARYSPPTAHETNGYSSPTPVTDGRRVWALFGSGVVACCDMDGNRLWTAFLETPRDAQGLGASPILAGGRLLCQVADMHCLEAETGKVLWKATGLRPGWGTAAPVDIGGVEAVATAGGEVVRLSDGAVLARKAAALDYGSPVAEGRMAWYVQCAGNARAACLRLPAQAADAVAPEVVWQTLMRNDRYYASSLVREGLVYAVTQKGVLTALDAGSGAVVHEKYLAPVAGATVFASITSAGPFIFVSADSGVTVVMKPGRVHEVVAVNRLEEFRSTPAFAGSRMYVRGLKSLWCIGR